MYDDKKSTGTNYGWWISGVLVLMTLSFVFDIWGDKRTVREQPLVEKVFYSVDPVRTPFAKAEMTQAGFKFNCNECHQNMEPPLTMRKLIAEHQDIVLQHEEAMTCYTCHSRKSREDLIDIYGTKVPFEESHNICRRCHGPRFRDWKRGIHGRPLGYWDKIKGESTNITCVYCHNPHAPQFQLMKPSPPPTRSDYITGDKETHHE